MATAIAEYDKIVKTFTQDAAVTSGQMFGKPCLKVNGKAFIAQHKETVVFKLSGPSHAKAMTLSGAVHWDPSGKGRPMKEWVAVQATAAKSFQSLAAAALMYVGRAV